MTNLAVATPVTIIIEFQSSGLMPIFLFGKRLFHKAPECPSQAAISNRSTLMLSSCSRA